MTIPQWLVKKRSKYSEYAWTIDVLKGLNTVCSSASCPNLMECYSLKHATFLIMGYNCTRNCAFCSVGKGKPLPLDKDEPEKISKAVAKLKLKHVVLTSVSRDDLQDGGAEQFVLTIQSIRKNTSATIEVLIPDFKGKENSLEKVVKAKPNIIAHNLETVAELQGQIRPQASYKTSLAVLNRIKEIDSNMLTKSGLMLGLGETDQAVLVAMKDIRSSNCDILTLGQYRQPSIREKNVNRFILEEGFSFLERYGYEIGFSFVLAGSYVRSSYRATEVINYFRR